MIHYEDQLKSHLFLNQTTLVVLFIHLLFEQATTFYYYVFSFKSPKHHILVAHFTFLVKIGGTWLQTTSEIQPLFCRAVHISIVFAKFQLMHLDLPTGAQTPLPTSILPTYLKTCQGSDCNTVQIPNWVHSCAPSPCERRSK